MPEQRVLQVAVGVIKNAQDQVLVALRHSQAHQGGLWEFPGGKIDPHETVMQALIRELQEELDITIEQASPLITVQHAYADITVQLTVLRVDAYTGQPRGREGQEIRWVALNDLNHLPFPAANAAIITAAQLPDFYAILDVDALIGQDSVTPSARIARLLSALQHLLDQGIKLIQARLKTLSAADITQFLQRAQPLCTRFSAHLLLNSLSSDTWAHAEGVHLTSHALMRLQQRPAHVHWLAASCHTPEQLHHAQNIGVDFVVLAPVLATLTHPNAATLGWTKFSAWVNKVNLPVYALGGMQKNDLERAKQAGAQGIAGIRLFMDTAGKPSTL
ncbi:MAG: Nudix family hydrolase [Methylococcales bacterium]|nr:Nudix family hydrolase [Methylococcales bacterium]